MSEDATPPDDGYDWLLERFGRIDDALQLRFRDLEGAISILGDQIVFFAKLVKMAESTSPNEQEANMLALFFPEHRRRRLGPVFCTLFPSLVRVDRWINTLYADLDHTGGVSAYLAAEHGLNDDQIAQLTCGEVVELLEEDWVIAQVRSGATQSVAIATPSPEGGAGQFSISADYVVPEDIVRTVVDVLTQWDGAFVRMRDAAVRKWRDAGRADPGSLKLKLDLIERYASWYPRRGVPAHSLPVLVEVELRRRGQEPVFNGIERAILLAEEKKLIVRQRATWVPFRRGENGRLCGERVSYEDDIFVPGEATAQSERPPQPDTDAPTAAAACDGGAIPSVVLQGKDQPVFVLGKEKPRLRPAQYRVIKKLVDAGADGLNKDGLEGGGDGGARSTLKTLMKSDPDWDAVIAFPGKAGRGYRIKPAP